MTGHYSLRKEQPTCNREVNVAGRNFLARLGVLNKFLIGGLERG